MFKLRLHPLYEIDGDIGGSVNNDSPSVDGEASASGDGNAPTPELNEQNSDGDVSKQESFAKRLKESTDKTLAEERTKWEAEQSEKFKNYEEYRKAAEYLQKSTGISDIISLKEEIELTELQERADRENLPPETLKRIDELEAKAAKFEEYEQQQNQSKEYQTFRETLDPFAKERGIEPEELHNFMYENGIENMDIAAKAMKAEEYERKANEKEAETIKRYLESKQAPRVEGSTGGAVSQAVDTSKMSWKELQSHTLARLQASKTPQ